MLSKVLYDFFDKHLPASDQWFAMQLWHKWSEFSTVDILKKTRPVSYQKGRLVLWVAHSVELQELSFHTETVKDRINSHFKKEWVKDIHFTLDKDILKKRKQSAQILKNMLKSKQ